MKLGDEVIYIGDGGVDIHNLHYKYTIGKTYIMEAHWYYNEEFIIVDDDNGYSNSCLKCLFMTPTEYRDFKINKILLYL